MSATQKIFDKISEREDGEEIPAHFPVKLVAPMADWRAAKAEYAALAKRATWLEAEMNKVAQFQLLMAQEYYPMVSRLTAALDGGKAL